MSCLYLHCTTVCCTFIVLQCFKLIVLGVWVVSMTLRVLAGVSDWMPGCVDTKP